MRGRGLDIDISWADAGLVFLIISASVLPFAEMIRHGYFLSDDFQLLLKARYARLGLPLILHSPDAALWRLSYRMYGMNPVGYHLTSVLLHTACSLSVYIICWTLVKEKAAPLAAALVFAVHPAHAEAVDWIAARGELLCAFFYAAALYQYIEYSKKGGGRPGHYVGALLSFFIALCFGQAAASFPAVALLYEAFFSRINGTPPRKAIMRVAPFFLMLSVSLAVGPVWVHMPLDGFIGRAYGHIGTLLFGLNAAVPGRSVFFRAAPLILAGVIMVSAVLSGRNRREAAFASSALAVSLLPVLGMDVSSDLSGSRFLYIPSVLFAVALGSALTPLPVTRGRALPGLCAAGLVLCYSVVLWGNQGPWIEASFITNRFDEQFKRFFKAPPTDACITLYNAPHDYRGAPIYPGSDRLAAQMALTYGLPGEKDIKLDFRDVGPSKRIILAGGPKAGRRIILEYFEPLEFTRLLYDSAREKKRAARCAAP